jgi:colanic acid/amylovoran biosynthesis protein
MDVARDARQWPEAPDYGVRFLPLYRPRHARYWIHSQRLPLPFLKRAGWPFPFPRWFKDQIESADAVISVGGDNYSLDYRIPSLLMGIDALAMDMGKPVVLWGASVGPFEREPHFVPIIRNHLARMDKVMIRETVSYQYLTEVLGLSNVIQMVDPAFTLIKDVVDCAEFWPEDQGQGVIGLNISPLIERHKTLNQDLVGEVVKFVNHAVKKEGYGVLLVPHVVPLDGSCKNNDAHYMDQILYKCEDLKQSIRMAPATFNASQLKYVISCLRFFIGARTHSTIAALSSGVPTISIAYSIKARGINRDLFGKEDFVLPTQSVGFSALKEKLLYLQENEENLKQILKDRIPEYKNNVSSATELLGKVF